MIIQPSGLPVNQIANPLAQKVGNNRQPDYSLLNALTINIQPIYLPQVDKQK
ncbi:MAG TPA: hypothetical protein VF326_14160 [Anaerolineaceae bacterium]